MRKKEFKKQVIIFLDGLMVELLYRTRDVITINQLVNTKIQSVLLQYRNHGRNRGVGQTYLFSPWLLFIQWIPLQDQHRECLITEPLINEVGGGNLKTKFKLNVKLFCLCLCESYVIFMPGKFVILFVLYYFRQYWK